MAVKYLEFLEEKIMAQENEMGEECFRNFLGFLLPKKIIFFV